MSKLFVNVKFHSFEVISLRVKYAVKPLIPIKILEHENMAEKLDKLRLMAQRLKDKVHLPQLPAGSREKVDQIITRYSPAVKVNEIAEKFKTETLSKKVQELVSKYEKFTGVEEIMALQNTVVEAQVT